ncbi:MAG: putative transposase [Acidimicrobiales bacterium]
MAIAASTLATVVPLPLFPAGSLHLADGVAFLEDTEGNGSVFLWGMAAWSWTAGDPVARRLAAVQLVHSKAARQRQVAAAFSVNEDTIMLWRNAYLASGVEGLIGLRRGPKGPSKLTSEMIKEIGGLRTNGLSLAQVAERVGLSTHTVRRAIAGTVTSSPKDATREGLVPLARPATRSSERLAARAGLLAEAAPVICEGAALPLAGALIALPGVVATGLLEVATAIYGARRHVAGVKRSAFYGLRSLLLSICFTALVGEPRAEGAGRLDPVAIGRLLGLDRTLEVSTLRRRTEELAETGRSGELIEGLARHHLGCHEEASGIFYVDGHVRAYHGGREIEKAHVARIRLAMAAEADTWCCDRNGDGLLVWSTPPHASLAGELRTVTKAIRRLVGEQARPTIAFDRGGWSPRLFAELFLGGFHVLTYRKGSGELLPKEAFSSYVFFDEAGREHAYLLADRPAAVPYDSGKRHFSCREIVRLDEATGHQTQVLTTREDPDPSAIAHQMFSRWRQENFFRYMRAHYGLDALDTYATMDDDPDRLVKNPARAAADAAVRSARRQLAEAEATEGRAALSGRRLDAELTDAFAAGRAEIDRLVAVAKAIPAKVALSQARPEAVRLDPERKRIFDAIRMASYNAESALARMLAPHYARAEDEARTLLREAFKSPADLEIVDDELHVRLLPLSAPRRTRAIAGLCEELTATKTNYPGTDLTLVFSVLSDC